MRTVGALPIGLGSMSWIKFTCLNAASALLWTFALVAVGFVFGAQIEHAVSEGWGFASVVLLVLMVTGIVFAWRRLNRLPGVQNGTGS